MDLENMNFVPPYHLPSATLISKEEAEAARQRCIIKRKIRRQNMETLDKMRCGGCGNQTFEIYSQSKNGETKLVTRCQGCKSDTIISVDKPQLKLEWGEKSTGILAKF